MEKGLLDPPFANFLGLSMCHPADENEAIITGYVWYFIGCGY